jgi:hypothetical protein
MTASAGSQARDMALIEELNARLLAGPTATIVLAAWCGEHGMASPARIHAELMPGPAAEASAETRARLGVGPDEPLGYRHVRLMCGVHVMSEAENWYVPARLTAGMREALAGTDTPFGAVIAPLGPKRENLEATPLWHSGPLPRALLRHRALVTGADGRPLAMVVETYMSGALEFPR